MARVDLGSGAPYVAWRHCIGVHAVLSPQIDRRDEPNNPIADTNF